MTGIINGEVSRSVDALQLKKLYYANKDKLQGECTDKTWIIFKGAIEAARIVIECLTSNSDQAGNLTQEDVEGAIFNLKTSIDRLRTEAEGYILVDKWFGCQITPENFEFLQSVEVSNGMLNAANCMSNCQTSVKLFNKAISQQKKWIEISFDWKTSVTVTCKKTGVEFRDSTDKLIFAICITSDELRYSYADSQSDSSKIATALEQMWTIITTNQGYGYGECYNIKFKVDFETKILEYNIVKKGEGGILASGTVSNILVNNLEKMVVVEEGQVIDNFIAIGGEEIIAQPSTKNILKGKTIYAFGDSIVAGHKYFSGFVDFVIKNEGMQIKKYAHNGAVISLGAKKTVGGYIVNHVQQASSASPDYVVFDGGTNDAENIHNNGRTPLYKIGILTVENDPKAFDTNTFAGSFEKTIYEIKQKWPSAKIIYVSAHKLGSRDWNTQLALREIELAACKKWGVTVADVFENTDLDTRIIEMKNIYTFDNLTAAGLPSINGSGTHPNIAAIYKYYVPVLTTTLLNLATVN